MAEDFIEQIYNKAYMTTKFRYMSESCQRGRYATAQLMWNDNIDLIAKICRDTVEYNQNLGIQLWDECKKISEHLEKHKFGVASDSFEKCTALLYESVAIDGKIDVADGNYRLYSTQSGFLNIEDLKNDEKFYSDIDPVWEQYHLAESLYYPKMKKVCILGCGLGYLPWQIFEVANESIDVYIYENNEKIIEYARLYGVLDRIPEERLFITVEKNTNDLLDKFSVNFNLYKDEFVSLYVSPFILPMLDTKQRDVLDELISMVHTGFEFNSFLEQNFYRNHSSVKFDIHDIDFKHYPKNWIVIAGGPSLNNNIEYIKEQMGKKTIICATTSYKRLINEGIRPDFMVVMDPQNRTYGHLANIEDYETPLILADTANWQFGEKYQGEKYLVNISGKFYSLDYQDGKWYSQGTVSAFAIDVAAFAGAERIEMVGMDLSFPTLYSHAEGTMDNEKVDTENMIKVPSVNGGNVYTTAIFVDYISEIEDQIKKYTKIEFINLSKDGALIKGCI